jgi:hypothetical protein
MPFHAEPNTPTCASVIHAEPRRTTDVSGKISAVSRTAHFSTCNLLALKHPTGFLLSHRPPSFLVKYRILIPWHHCCPACCCRVYRDQKPCGWRPVLIGTAELPGNHWVPVSLRGTVLFSSQTKERSVPLDLETSNRRYRPNHWQIVGRPPLGPLADDPIGPCTPAVCARAKESCLTVVVRP